MSVTSSAHGLVEIQDWGNMVVTLAYVPHKPTHERSRFRFDRTQRLSDPRITGTLTKQSHLIVHMASRPE